jgi:hypothetical protein
MAETAALLVEEVLPRRPMRQWVLSLPFALRFLLQLAHLEQRRETEQPRSPFASRAPPPQSPLV